MTWHDEPISRVLERLDSNTSGLRTADAQRRLESSGANVLPRGKSKGPLDLLWRQVGNTLPLVLLGSGLLALAFGRVVDGSVVVAVVALNAIIGAVQEFRAGRAIEALAALVPEEVTVLRDGDTAMVAAAELVPGDVVLVEAGGRVPADMRLLALRSLNVNEAALTGESVPATKQLEPVAKDSPLGDRSCMLFSGTMVASGTATGLVVSTGPNTELGRISAMLNATQEIQTPLTRALRKFGNVLTAAIGIVAYMILLTALRRGYEFVDAVRASVSLVVAAVPSSLPAIITVALAVAVRRMAKRNAIVRTLPSIETLGSTNVICTDKTGTLTRGEMAARVLWTPSGFYQLSGAGYIPQGDLLRDGIPFADPIPGDVLAVVHAGILCNDAALRRKDGQWTGVGDPTEIALVVAAAKMGLEASQARASHPRLDEIPFTSDQKFMATLHQVPGNGRRIVLKGAPEAVLRLCDRLGRDGALDRDHVHSQVAMLAARGMRVLAIASSDPRDAPEKLGDAAPTGLSLLGLVASIDPPRPEAIAAIATCHRAGIAVKMVTGDHPSTAKAIGIEMGITEAADRVVTGDELEAIPSAQLELVARTVHVFSRVAPEHKLRLVRALQARRDVVAMTGDGVNDAPALKQADVGVAMGVTGTGAAKEAAAVILVDDNFASIAAAVEDGRRCYDNLIKSLMFVVPTNLGQSLVLMVGVLFFPVVEGVPLLPIVPLQILWVNLVTGVTLAIPLAFEAPEPDLTRRPPRPRDEPIFTPQLAVRCLLVGGVMALGAIGLFLDAYYGEIVMPHDFPAVALRKAQTITSTTVVLFQVFYLWQCRSLRSSSIAINPFSNPTIFLGIGMALLMQVAFVYVPVMNLVFHSAPLGLRDWLAAGGAAASVLPVMALEKSLYEKRVARAKDRRAGIFVQNRATRR